MVRLLYILFIFILFTELAVANKQSPGVHGFSGEVTLENRFFVNEDPLSGRDQSEVSLIVKPEYSYSWDNDRKVIHFIPYARMNHPDDQKTHWDIREASYVAAWDQWELRAGISKVFWGVTESQHLVDIINQTDAVENFDGEDKLGQPMINPTLVTGYGNFGLFILPYFRERTFAGKNGRLRVPLVIDENNPIYLHRKGEKHIDYASRYSHTIGDIDLGLSFFKGTDRAPLFINSNPNQPASGLRPFYIQTEQFGVDAQYVYKDWLIKFESIHKDSQLAKPYTAHVAGFEYTFTNHYKGMDIGILIEHLYDNRGSGGAAIFNNHTFFGSRLAVNDEQSTEFLVGAIVNNEEGDLTSLRVEGSRRINQNWKWEVEGNAFLNSKPSQFLHHFRDDDYFQLSLSFFF